MNSRRLVQLDNFLVFEFRSLRDGPLLLLHVLLQNSQSCNALVIFEMLKQAKCVKQCTVALQCKLVKQNKNDSSFN
jgi:hypothetical protein